MVKPRYPLPFKLVIFKNNDNGWTSISTFDCARNPLVERDNYDTDDIDGTNHIQLRSFCTEALLAIDKVINECNSKLTVGNGDYSWILDSVHIDTVKNKLSSTEF